MFMLASRNVVDEEPLSAAPRYRPPTLDELVQKTRFTRRELRILYRSFKQGGNRFNDVSAACRFQGCPEGVVTSDKFQDIYAQFFPHGSPTRYAELVFGTLDRDRDGIINFEEFVMGLSVLSRGDEAEKLTWIFDLYDTNRRGAIDASNVQTVVEAIYELLGHQASPPPSTQMQRVANKLLLRFDRFSEGVLQRDAFVTNGLKDELLRESLHLFDTRI